MCNPRWPPATAVRLLLIALLSVAGIAATAGKAQQSSPLAAAAVEMSPLTGRQKSRFEIEGLYQGALRGVLRKPSSGRSVRVGDVLLENATRVAPFTEPAASGLTMYGEPPADKRAKTAPRDAIRVLPPRHRTKPRRAGDERRPDPATGIVDERVLLRVGGAASAPDPAAPLVAWGVFLHAIPVLEVRLERSPPRGGTPGGHPLRGNAAAADASKLRLTLSCGECRTVVAAAAHPSASLSVPPPSDGADANAGAAEGSVLLNDPVDPTSPPILHFLGRRHSFAVALLTATSSIRATVRRGVPRDDASAQRTTSDGGWHVVLDGLSADDVDVLFVPGPEPLAAHRQLSVLLGRAGSVAGFISAADANVQLELAEVDAARVNPVASRDLFRAIVEASDLTGVTNDALHNRTCTLGDAECVSRTRSEGRTRVTALRPSLSDDVRRVWEQTIAGNGPAATVAAVAVAEISVEGRRLQLRWRSTVATG